MPSPVHFTAAAIRFHAHISSLFLNHLRAIRGETSIQLAFVDVLPPIHLNSWFMCLDAEHYRCFLASHGLPALSSARSFNVNLSICPWYCWLSWHTQPLNISAPRWERRGRAVHRMSEAGVGGGGAGQVPAVTLLASVEEAVSLTVSRGSFLTF